MSAPRVAVDVVVKETPMEPHAWLLQIRRQKLQKDGHRTRMLDSLDQRTTGLRRPKQRTQQSVAVRKSNGMAPAILNFLAKKFSEPREQKPKPKPKSPIPAADPGDGAAEIPNIGAIAAEDETEEKSPAKKARTELPSTTRARRKRKAKSLAAFMS